MKKIIISLTILIALMGNAMAEKRYVTDRILLGIHSEADETSTLIKSVPSGTELEVIETTEGFVKIKLSDGTEGWVSTGFIMEQPPASRKYDVLANQYEKTTEELDNLKKENDKLDRELQVRRDQVSNANTTIRELKKRSSKNGAEVVADVETEKKLDEALKEVETLKAEVTDLKAKEKPELEVGKATLFAELESAKAENKILHTRIDIAIAHLNGQRMPSPEELASISPDFPAWYWGLLAVILILGIFAGLFIMDYRFRRRHGGFRI
jgi:SH3 domain protein